MLHPSPGNPRTGCYFVGIVDGTFVIQLWSNTFDSGRKSAPTVRSFDTFWQPPEMQSGKERAFPAFVTFDERGGITAVDYFVIDRLPYQGEMCLMRIAGAPEKEGYELATLLAPVVHTMPSKKCTLTFPVVLHEGQKLFSLGDGWHCDAIPALEEFEDTTFLSGMYGEKDRFEHELFNLRLKRGGKEVAQGCVTTTGGMGEYPIVHLGGVTHGDYPKEIAAEQLEVGDELVLTFNFWGTYPTVQSFLQLAAVKGADFPGEIGKSYAPDEFMALSSQGVAANAQRILPDMLSSKIIRLLRTT